MDPKVPKRFFASPSKAKGITFPGVKPNKLQRQERCPSIDDSCILSCAVKNLMLSLQMYLTSARLVSRLANDYYDSVQSLLAEEDRENLLKILELRQGIKTEVQDMDQTLQNILNRIQQSRS